jgi:hypothetical protein
MDARLHSRPLSTRPLDIEDWLCARRKQDRPAAQFVRCRVADYFAERPFVTRTIRAHYCGRSYSTVPGSSREHLVACVHEAVRTERPVGFGPVQWLLLAWRIKRMVTALVDLCLSLQEFLDALDQDGRTRLAAGTTNTARG